MTLRSLALAVLLAAAALIWVFDNDPEGDVRDAHAELKRLIDKSSAESGAGAALSSLSLRDLFADPVVVTGDSGGLSGSYSPEDFANTIVRLRTVAQRIELTFGELNVEFSNPETAVTRFSAELVADSEYAGGVRQELRQVTSRMQQAGGAWLFSEFLMASPDG